MWWGVLNFFFPFHILFEFGGIEQLRVDWNDDMTRVVGLESDYSLCSNWLADSVVGISRCVGDDVILLYDRYVGNAFNALST